MTTKGAPAMKPIDQRDGERGQALPLFVLMLIALMAGTGLVVDVGGAWAQERSQQKASDVSALAAATQEANGGTRQEIIDTAIASAVANGYQAGEVDVNIPPTTGKYGPGGSGYSANDCSSPALYPCWVEVVITKPHNNFFAGIIGQGSWDVSARAVAVGGIANAVVNGIAPVMFHEDAINPANNPGDPHLYCNPQDNKCTPNNDFPVDKSQFNWTTFCEAGGNCNVNSSDAITLIEEFGHQVTITYGMDLGAHNQGQHTSVCHALMDQFPDGGEFPVAINNENGEMVGFWVWHFDAANTVCEGTDGMQLSGWFVENLNFTIGMTIVAGAPQPGIGQYTATLVE
jgi:Putative Flp pilus-assembly TadE/G-like